MQFLSHPLSKSLIGFEELFSEFDRMSSYIISTKYYDDKYPIYNVIKTNNNEYRIEIAVAGFVKDELEIEVKDNLMTIHASKDYDLATGLPKDEDKQNYLHKGIAGRSFKKQFKLSDYMEVKDAKLEEGMHIILLNQSIPEKEKPKQIKIN